MALSNSSRLARKLMASTAPSGSTAKPKSLRSALSPTGGMEAPSTFVNTTDNARKGKKYTVVTVGDRTFHHYDDGTKVEIKRFRDKTTLKPRSNVFDSRG